MESPESKQLQPSTPDDEFVDEERQVINDEEKQAINELEGIVHDLMKDTPEHHGIKHIENVRQLAREICKEEKGDLLAVEIAALMHDLGRPIEQEQNRPHQILSLFEAHKYLSNLYDKEFIDKKRWRSISQAIIRHSGMNRESDQLTLDIIRDADRLEGMGLSGTLRCIAHAKDQNLPFYKSGEKIVYPNDYTLTPKDKQSAVSNVSFVRSWANLLKLESAKRIAQKKVKPMEDFLKLFQKHQGILNYDTWINFLEDEINKNKETVSEDDLQEFLK
jgi:uncharacterized protein